MIDQPRGIADLLLPVLVGAALFAAAAHFTPRPASLDDLQARLRLQPTNIQYHQQAADLFLQSNQPAQAAIHLQAILALQPGNPAATLAYARICLDAGQPILAEQCLLTAEKANRRNRDAAFHLQMAELFLRVPDDAHADGEFNTGTAFDPRNDAALFQWGMMLFDDGRPERAAIPFRLALNIQPDNALYHVQLARALRDSNLFTQAMDEFTTALNKDIKCVPAYLELAQTFQRFNTDAGYNSAVKFLRQGIEAVPDNVSLKAALAALLSHPRDPLQREASLWEAATLLQSCVDLTAKSDLNLLQFAAQAWSLIGLDDKAQSLIQDAIALCRAQHAAPEVIENLLQSDQQYVLNQAPPSGRNLTPYLSVDSVLSHDRRSLNFEAVLLRLAITGTTATDPFDNPLPNPPQPRIDTLLARPLHLSDAPGPTNALDPALYTGPAIHNTMAAGTIGGAP